MRMKHPGTLTASTCVDVTGDRFHTRARQAPLASALAAPRPLRGVPILTARAQFERKQAVGARPFVAANGGGLRGAGVPLRSLTQVVDDLLLERRRRAQLRSARYIARRRVELRERQTEAPRRCVVDVERELRVPATR